MCQFWESRVEEGFHDLKKAVDTSRGNTWPMGFLGVAHAAAGEREEALEIARQLESRRGDEYVSALHIGAIYTHLGKIDTAFDWMQKAYEERDALFFTINTAFLPMVPLRSDPRFDEYVRRIQGEQ